MKITVFSQISIDGKLTLGAGNSSKGLFSLLNEGDIEFIHRFRGKVDGIVVGRNTILTDNPFLTNRYEVNKNPVRIIPTTTLDFPMDSHVLTDEGRTIVVTTESDKNVEKIRQIRELGKEILICGTDSVDFKALCVVLENKYGITSLMVEGGGFLNWNVFDKDLVDEIVLMQLPIIIGGGTNITLVDGEGYEELTFTKKFKVVEMLQQENYTLMRYLKAV